jgi:hypothetical protein
VYGSWMVLLFHLFRVRSHQENSYARSESPVNSFLIEELHQDDQNDADLNRGPMDSGVTARNRETGRTGLHLFHDLIQDITPSKCPNYKMAQ